MPALDQGERIIEMRDEMDARIWAEHHQDFSNLVAGAIAAIGPALRRLHRMEFDQPWRRRPKQEH
jgi:hypothetical protein